MTNFRVKAGDWQPIAANPFCSEFAVRVTGDIESKLNEGMFSVFLDNLRPGDGIRIISFEDDAWVRVCEIAQLIITHVGIDSVQFHRIGEISKVPEAKPVIDEQDDAMLHVKRGFAGEFLVNDDAGNTLETFKSKKAAEDYVQGAM